MDDELHGRTLYDWLILKHISCWNRDEHPRREEKRRCSEQEGNRLFYHEVVIARALTWNDEEGQEAIR